MRALYVLTIFLGSALLFLVEPMVAKMILPIFGGSPAVWNACVVFFQLMLLLGYAYAHASTKWLGPSRQPILHVLVVGLAIIALPFGIKQGFAPNATSQPAFQVIGLLLVMVGLPFFAISAQAPLLQRWFAHTKDPNARDPYFLYSASNLGSMLALLAYPALIEPVLGLTRQSLLWTIGYGGLCVLTLGSAVALLVGQKGVEVTSAPGEDERRVTAKDRAKWVLLSAAPSSLMLGVTSYLTTNVAPVPLLWVIPLALYLLTFILAFSGRVRINPNGLSRLAMFLVLPAALVLALELWSPMVPLSMLHLIVFFVTAWACHTRLSRLRPSASHLTEYYLWISAGGVIGGAFNGFFAPIFFRSLVEYPIAIAVALVLMRQNVFGGRRKVARDLAWIALGLAIFYVVSVEGRHFLAVADQRGGDGMEAAVNMTIVALAVIGCFLAIDRPLRYGVLVAGLMIILPSLKRTNANIIYQTRDFFGVKRVYVNGPFHNLLHGSTLHGIQNFTAENRRVPLTYYNPHSPIGDVFHEFSGAKQKDSVAAVGLGTGTLAAYGKPGQKFTFYEIDPDVVRIAQNPRFFTYLSDSQANVNIVIGDARLELAKAAPSSYGLIILDAFSSDSVPVHLLTKEAVEMYLSKLEPHGVIAFHTSNKYLDLPPVLARIARSLGLAIRYREGQVRAGEEDKGMSDSHWVILARDKADFGDLASSILWENLEHPEPGPIWTDDFSNVLSTMHVRD